jgi:VWFA-related protein
MLGFVLCAVLAGSPQGVQETIEVSRILVDVRVTDSQGVLLTDLTAAELDVSIGGVPMIVESATWVDDEAVASPSRRVDEAGAEAVSPRPASRLIVFFVQTDFTRAPSRLSGHMKFLPYALQMLHSLQPADRVAVFSFDSHLKFRLDFTTDRQAADEAIRATLAIDQPGEPGAVAEPSLRSRLTRRMLHGARDSESALLVLGNALQSIPGPKSILLLGWGLGQLVPGGRVKMTWRWDDARAALEAARVTLFSIDTTYADAHDLEKGLIRAAEDTGGIYVKTYQFAGGAADRVRYLLQGRYELELRASRRLKTGSQRLEVRTKRAGAIVLAPASVLIRD